VLSKEVQEEELKDIFATTVITHLAQKEEYLAPKKLSSKSIFINVKL